MEPTQYREAVMAELRAEMARRRVNQTELARRLGKNKMWVSDRMRGKTALTVDDLVVIAEALDMEPSDLLPPIILDLSGGKAA